MSAISCFVRGMALPIVVSLSFVQSVLPGITPAAIEESRPEPWLSGGDSKVATGLDKKQSQPTS